jgi:hypothetical protein
LEEAQPVRPAALVLVVLAAAGCAAFGPAALDPLPGQRVVLGRVDVDGFETTDGLLQVVKVDGTFAEVVPFTNARRDFAVTLPPGQYRVTELRAVKDRDSTPSENVFPLRLAFEVGPEPATYIGTLRFNRRFGRDVRIEVLDEYEDTVRALRRLYSDLPPAAARRLVQPAA